MATPLITRLGTPMSSMSPMPGSPLGRSQTPNGKEKLPSPSLPSLFQQHHEVQIKKHRAEYQSLIERLHIEFSANHAQVIIRLPQLRRRYDLEAEEIQHTSEDMIQKHLNRISSLRQEYTLTTKDLLRRHLEQQQRRCFSGASAEFDGCEAAIAAGLAAANELSNETNRSPLPNTPFKKPAAPLFSESGFDTPAKQSSQRLLEGGASAGGGLSTSPSVLANSIGLGSPSGGVMYNPGGPNANFSNEFERLEGTYDRAVTVLGRSHDQCQDVRQHAVESWDMKQSGCMEDMRTLQQEYSGKLDQASAALDVFQEGMRESLSQVQSDFVANEERYRRLLEALFTQAAGKLHQLLLDYLGGGCAGTTASAGATLGREPPRDEAQIQELQGAFMRHAGGLRAEFLMQLEAHESAIRALLSQLAPRLRNLQADHSSGVGSHERSLSALLIGYDAEQAALGVEYDGTEAAHRNELSAIRTQHLQSLAGVRESFLGELAGLMEEYRNRVAELKQTFMLKHEVSLLET